MRRDVRFEDRKGGVCGEDSVRVADWRSGWDGVCSCRYVELDVANHAAVILAEVREPHAIHPFIGQCRSRGVEYQYGERGDADVDAAVEVRLG